MSALVSSVKCPQRYREFNSNISEYDSKLRGFEHGYARKLTLTALATFMYTYTLYSMYPLLFLLVFRNSKLQPEDKGVVMFTERPLYEVTAINQNHAI